MTGRPRSIRARIYQSLRTDCGFTHHQTKFLIRNFMSDIGSWDNVLTIGHRKEKEIWQAPAEIVAALSMKHDPVIAGRSILNHCWPDQTKHPEAPFVCASIAAGIVNKALSYSDSERREMWRIIERLLRQEEKSAIEDWEDRLILKYLQIRGLMPP